jgi:dTDP-4-amino-4,6-dideoxygalactose transaminase
MINLFDTSTPLDPIRAELSSAIEAVIAGGNFILGSEVAQFEVEFAQACGVEHAVGVANGTDAIELALRALGVGPGDDVVVPSFTFYASAEAIPPTGARPVFCDVDPDTGCITEDTVKAALTPNTKAVIAVDLFGNIAPIPLIEKLGVPVLEDAAQAAGSTLCERPAGSLGSAASFSFFPSKNLGCFGDGGAVISSDPNVAEMVRTLRFHGSPDRQTFEHVGRNSRLDEIQAAALRVMLPQLPAWTSARKRAASRYLELGIGDFVRPIEAVAGVDPAWHLFVVRHPRAEQLSAALAQVGIESRGYYRTPVHRQPAMASWGAGVDLPATEELARTNLAIPISPVLGDQDAETVVEAIATAVAGLS